jgi:hypothetical protein
MIPLKSQIHFDGQYLLNNPLLFAIGGGIKKNICLQECGRFMENISNIHTKDCYTEGGQK